MKGKTAKSIDRKIDRLGDLLDEAEGKTKPSIKKKDDDELDLDSAWSKS